MSALLQRRPLLAIASWGNPLRIGNRRWNWRIKTHSFPHHVQRTALRLSINSSDVLANNSHANKLNAADKQLRDHRAGPAFDQAYDPQKPFKQNDDYSKYGQSRCGKARPRGQP